MCKPRLFRLLPWMDVRVVLPLILACPLEGATEGSEDLQPSGAVREIMIIGPIDLGGAPAGGCDDGGKLGTTDYLSDGATGEANLAVVPGDELRPDFGGAAGGLGVKISPNQSINPHADEGILTVWTARPDSEGAVEFDEPQHVGNLEHYIIYSLVYLENTTGTDLDVLLEVGSDDGVKVLLNGELVHLNPACRSLARYGSGDRVNLTLVPGKNALLVAVVELMGHTAVRLAIRDLDDVPLTDGSVLACLTPSDGPPPSDARYVRMDVTGDGTAGLQDALFFITVVLFGSADTLDCPDTADANDDGRLGFTDAIYILAHTFLDRSHRPPPKEPFPVCGPDPTPDDLDKFASNNTDPAPDPKDRDPDKGSCVYPEESCP